MRASEVGGMMSTNIKNSQNNIVKKLNETRSRYEGSFTVHGINHINSGTVLEKVLWILCVLGALVGSVFMTYGLFDSYLKKDVDTKISIKENIRTRLPTIYICSGGALSYLDSYIDCSSTVSKSYDEFHCQIMNKTCPKFCDGGRCSNLAEHLRLVPTCPPELYGQCVALNAEGDVTQSVLFPSDSYIPETRNKENFPYEMYIRPPGETDPLMSLLSHNFYSYFNGPGEYEIVIEKTTIQRQPAPYSSCIEANSDEAASKSMFIGPYTVRKCIATCNLKTGWQQCKTTYWSARNLLREKEFQRQDRDVEEIEECIFKIRNHTTFINETIGCENDCRPPCFEESYKMRSHYYPNSGGMNDTLQLRIIMDRKETIITEEPKQQLLVVLSALGGTLGLLAGASVLSLIELFIWIVLFMAEKMADCCTRKEVQPQ